MVTISRFVWSFFLVIFIAALIALSYLAFVFFAEMTNPFIKPRGHVLRVKWRYGLRMALSVLIGGCITLTLLIMTELTLHVAVGIGLVIAAVLALGFSLDKIMQFLRR